MDSTMTENETDIPVKPKRSKLNYLSVLSLCVTSAFLTASVILIYQYKLGIPFSLIVSLLIAAAIAILIPLLISVLFTSFFKNTLYGGYIAFVAANLAISIGTGVLIF